MFKSLRMLAALAIVFAPLAGVGPQRSADRSRPAGVSTDSRSGVARAHARPDDLVAIDVLLDADPLLTQAARSVNAGMRADFPDGFTLDAAHTPHVTVLQGYVRQSDMDEVQSAVVRVLEQHDLSELKLEATAFYDIPFGKNLGLAGIVIRPTSVLLQLQEQIAASLKPHLAEEGSAGAFVPNESGTPISSETVGYVNTFRESASGEKYNPHVTVGVGTRQYLDRLKAEPFQSFSTAPVSVSIYQLGDLGTAQRKLWSSAEPLASWNEGNSKAAIVSFVERVTTKGSSDYVPPGQRIAVFDNDGTLWCEQPAYFQLFFAIDRVKALAPEHPEWKEEEPFKNALAGDMKAMSAQGEKGIAQIVAATHAGMTVEEFNAIVKDWLHTARHPKTGKPFTQMVYQPMLEVLDYLRANGFKTFIVSGGGVEFMRAFAEETYGIPPEQVIGSRGELTMEMRDGKPVLVKLPKIDLVDDGPGKPVGIQQQIGRRPVMAFGNSDGDLQMLQYTTAGDGPRFALIVHHTDAEREFAYDRGSHIGKLDKALEEAVAKGWTVVDMKKDWKRVFAFEK